MKALRRSLKQDRGEPRQQVSIQPKSAITIVPPKKVIRALYNYEPQSNQELGFVTGDFFHVIGREDDTEWYEACNPATNARGLVPVSFFQALGRTERDSTGPPARPAQSSHDTDSGYSERTSSGAQHGMHQQNMHQQSMPPPMSMQQQSMPPPSMQHQNMQYQGMQHGGGGGGYGGPPGQAHTTNISAPISGPKPMSANPQRQSKMGKGGMVYGIVQYDFIAERPDELEAKAGEAIIVIARSTPEWFVAKPIGRLGGPGLIPVAFIQIRDMTSGEIITDASSAVERAGVPQVEEWKRMAADYKNSSISLGKFEAGGGQMQQDMERLNLGDDQREQFAPQHAQSSMRQSQSDDTPRGNQFNIGRAMSGLLYPISAGIPRFVYQDEKYYYVINAIMADGSHWELFRLYEDFYDFQIALLTRFPDESGQTGKPRVLPFMPGPVWVVTEIISNGRRQNLDDYIKKLLEMPQHISRCDLVKQLFMPRDGDTEIDPENPPPNHQMQYSQSHAQPHEVSRMSGGSMPSSADSRGASPHSSKNNLSGTAQFQANAGLSPPPPRTSQQGAGPLPGSGGSAYYRDPADLYNPMGGQKQQSWSPPQQQGQQGQQGHGQQHPQHQHHNSQGQGQGFTRQSLNEGSRESLNYSQQQGQQQQQQQQQHAAPHAMTTSSNPTIKVKIFFQDDLIAIRVPTDVSYAQLREKLRERLGVGDNAMVQYKDETSQRYVELRGDNDLDDALRGGLGKLTLAVN